jgi:hypothetical protein
MQTEYKAVDNFVWAPQFIKKSGNKHVPKLLVMDY